MLGLKRVCVCFNRSGIESKLLLLFLFGHFIGCFFSSVEFVVDRLIDLVRVVELLNHSESSLSSLDVMLFFEQRARSGANVLLHQCL